MLLFCCVLLVLKCVFNSVSMECSFCLTSPVTPVA
jgi:hypothetical protein